MAQSIETSKRWPTALNEGDDLYALTNDDTDEVEYLVFSSIEKRKTFARVDGAWMPVNQDFIESFDDPKYSLEFVDIDYIDKFDEEQKAAYPQPDRTGYPSSTGPITAATKPTVADRATKFGYKRQEGCPPATQDIKLNLKNRANAIRNAGYGPMNPALENVDFWQEKAETWSVSVEDAKKSICGNCAVFVVTTKMQNCIADGLSAGETTSENAWDAISLADLGYCEALDFKCAGSRTCNAWVAGGPITDETER